MSAAAIALLAKTVLGLLQEHIGLSVPSDLVAKIFAHLPTLFDLGTDLLDDGTLTASGLNKLSALILDVKEGRL